MTIVYLLFVRLTIRIRQTKPKREDKKNISLDALVEAILNYGNEKNIKKLFELVGIKKVAEIFRKQASRKRVNYHNRTVHYFNLYFQKNA